MEVAGPLAVQWGFRIAGETLPDEEETITTPPGAPRAP